MPGRDGDLVDGTGALDASSADTFAYDAGNENPRWIVHQCNRITEWTQRRRQRTTDIMNLVTPRDPYVIPYLEHNI